MLKRKVLCFFSGMASLLFLSSNGHSQENAQANVAKTKQPDRALIQIDQRLIQVEPKKKKVVIYDASLGTARPSEVNYYEKKDRKTVTRVQVSYQDPEQKKKKPQPKSRGPRESLDHYSVEAGYGYRLQTGSSPELRFGYQNKSRNLNLVEVPRPELQLELVPVSSDEKQKIPVARVSGKMGISRIRTGFRKGEAEPERLLGSTYVGAELSRDTELGRALYAGASLGVDTDNTQELMQFAGALEAGLRISTQAGRGSYPVLAAIGDMKLEPCNLEAGQNKLEESKKKDVFCYYVTGGLRLGTDLGGKVGIGARYRHLFDGDVKEFNLKAGTQVQISYDLTEDHIFSKVYVGGSAGVNF